MARTVLLADDSVTAQNMGRRILIDAGYEVVTVNNGSAALKKAHESRPDLIVLDVYMPGYGGLEVCQRLKESEQTARIPILLTVGKMEPFKPEEARRARADAHIVKPFEASELLAALTRLEDRIVPQLHPEPARGRKSKSEKRSRLSRVIDPTMSYDDTQSDKIAYLAHVKQRHSIADAEEPTEVGQHTREVGSGQAEAASAASQSLPEEELPAKPPTPSMPMPMSVYAASQLQELPVVAEPAPIEQDSTVGQEENLPNLASSEQKPEVSAMQALSAAEETSSVSAKSSTVGNTEASAAVVTGEHRPAVIESVASGVESQPPKEVLTSTDAVTPEPSVAQSGVEAQTSSKDLANSEEVPAEPAQTVAPTRWVAENVALTAEEAALELEREMHEVRAQFTSAASSEGEIAGEVQPETSTLVESPKSEETKGATFAAAASATSSSAVGTTVPEAEPEPPVPSDAAAAWENWQHIRDSVMGSQTAISLSESVAEVVQENVPEPTAEAAPANVPAGEERTEAPADADSDSAVISSIVDSVLAELKPKLMAEISKKLKK